MARLWMAALLIVCLHLVSPANALAQEPPALPRVGLSLAFSPSSPSGGVIGLMWQRSERLAVRPEFSLSTRISPGATTSNSQWQVGGVVTVMRYIARKDNVGLYVGPRVSYNRLWVSSSSGTSASSSFGVGPSVGLEYDLTRRIGVYGEAGALYTYSWAASNTSTVPTSGSHFVSSRSSLGLNLFF